MTFSGGGRTKLNIKVHIEKIIKSDHIYFAWKDKWSWLTPEYNKLRQELAETKLPVISKRVPDHRTIRPIPQTVNHEYGWLSNKEEFRLNKWGPDIYIEPILLPNDDD